MYPYRDKAMRTKLAQERLAAGRGTQVCLTAELSSLAKLSADWNHLERQ